jgi:hypothetical protein
MATIPYKLEDITSEYSLFLDNQVLTANQLNEIVHYFEDQQRLSRILLTGVGRVCGFELLWNAGTGSVELECGVGVTTDGDLLHHDRKYTYTQFKSFTDDNARYPLFYSGESQYNLWELFEGGVSPEDVPGLSALNGFQAATEVHPNNLAVILYVENFDKSPDICTKLDCDNLGNRQINKIRVLLIRKTDLEEIINDSDTIFQTCRKAGNHFFDLPKIAAPRVILNASVSQSFSALANAYSKAIKNELGALQSAVTVLIDGFKWLLDPKNQTSNASIQARLAQVFQSGIAVPDLDIQYRYDLFKDVIATYAELRAVLWEMCVNCCPDVDAFPKHLMVRELVVTDSHQAQYRHGFYPSPAVAKETNNQIHDAKALYQRLINLIFNYAKRQGVPVKITPSKMPLLPLGKRAIPFYLNADIHKVWNADKMRSHREKENLSYLAADFYGETNSVKNPLEYSIDAHDFLRIEGHVGQSFNTAITDISRQIQRYQLPIEVIGLRLGNVADSIDINDYECYFEDLLVILMAWQEEQKCVWSAISKFFSGFYLKSPETHIEFGSRIQGEKVVEEKPKEKEAAPASAAGKSLLKESLGRVMYVAGNESTKYVYNVRDLGISEYQNYAKNPVEENLVKEADYVGFVFDNVIQQHPNASYAEIKDLAISQIDKIPEVKKWDADVYEMAVNIPVNMLSLAYEVNQMKPASIAELNVEGLDSFQVSMERICQSIKRWQSTIGKQFTRANYSRVGYEDRYQQLLSQVAVNCCAADKLEILLEEIERRKLKILEMTMLSKYMEKHPGMEHMAGVPKGGTFILVYKGQSRDSVREEAATEPQAARKEKEKAVAVEEMLRAEVAGKKAEKTAANTGWRMITDRVEEKKSEIEMVLEAGRQGNSGVDMQKFIDQLMSLAAEENITANVPVGDFQVVADFALPYLCCSDCPPVSFIVPKERVSLIIQDRICYVKGMDAVPITVVPADGEVKTAQGEGLVTKDDGGQWFFVPDNLPAALFGTVIEFTVNDQITDAKTVVFHQPEPAIELVGVECNIEKNAATATFRNTTPTVSGVNFTYEWSFGDGSTETNSSLLVTHVYRGIKPNVSQKFNVTLKATNRLCTETTEPLEVEVLCNQDQPEEPKCLEVSRENYLKFKELFGAIEPKDLSDFIELYEMTEGIFATVDESFDKVYSGEFNANLFPQMSALIKETLSTIVEAKEQREILIQLFRIQLMLLLSILRCQDLDITEKQKELFDLLSQLPDIISRLIEEDLNIDPDGTLTDYLSKYLESMESDRGILKGQIDKILSLIKV